MKIVFLEAGLYFAIAVCAPLGEFLASDRQATNRAIAAIAITCVVGGCNALKAFLSTSFSRQSGELRNFLDDFTAASATPASTTPTTTKPNQ